MNHTNTTQPSNEQSEPLLTKTAGAQILRSILAGPRATSTDGHADGHADGQDPSIHVPAFSRFIKGPPEFFFWP